jgi:hypothetical protein
MPQIKRTPKEPGTPHRHNVPTLSRRPERAKKLPTAARSRFAQPPKGQVQPRFRRSR